MNRNFANKPTSGAESAGAAATCRGNEYEYESFDTMFMEDGHPQSNHVMFEEVRISFCGNQQL